MPTINVVELNNMAEWWRQHLMTTNWDHAMYLLSKYLLSEPVPDLLGIFEWLDAKQNADGSWQNGVYTTLYATQRTVLTYFENNRRIRKSMYLFFQRYDTWAEALAYDQGIHGPGLDGRDLYHIIYTWAAYYRGLPPWTGTFFSEMEADLSWTLTADFHRTTHIIYSYVLARRPIPGLNDILDTVFAAQLPDGSFGSILVGRPVYTCSIAITLLREIKALYPGFRTEEIKASLIRTIPWIQSQYHTIEYALDSKNVMCGYFGSSTNVEDFLFSGILCGGQVGILPHDIDMTFVELVAYMNQTFPKVPVSLTVPSEEFGRPTLDLNWRSEK